MKANLKRSAAAVLGTLLFTVAPAITHAAPEQEWFQTQLQLTDGYTSEASKPALNDNDASRTDAQASRNADGRTGYVGADRGSALIDQFQG
jgi:hypothetical protein